MRLASGTCIGPYEVAGVLGAGGMGEVYRATDTVLKRQVALKVLPPEVANDPERVARFQREAEVLASLNHSNIAHLYGIERSGGTLALVMELVEGPTLADRIEKGAIPVDEALPIAKQIAEALEAAHEQGIIHRDLKPANIKVRDDGTVKVLDFGLAKAMELTGGAPSGAAALTNSPTITSPALMTGVGVLLGTAAYMSPEQAKGRPADKRSDIWAFGCVLFEMLTTRRAFAGEDVSDTLANILKSEPNWTSLPSATPVPLRRLMKRCFEKTPRRRLADIADARYDLEEAGSGTDSLAAPAIQRTVSWERLVWAGLVLLALAAGFALPRRVTTELTPAEVRFEIETPRTNERPSLALSPDGTRIVFVANTPGVRQLWMRALNSTNARPIDRTEDARYPFWSPRGDALGFFAQGKLKILEVATGAVRVVADAPRGLGGSWSEAGVIVFAPTYGGPLHQITQTGGVSRPVTRMEGSIVRHASPFFLPDGRHFLFYADGNDKDRGVYVGQLDDLSARRVIGDADAAAVMTAGHLLFPRGGALVAQPFDVTTQSVMGEPVQVADSIYADPLQSASALSAAPNGTFIYRARVDAGIGARLAWFDRVGRETDRIDQIADANANSVALSPDQKRVAIGRGQQRGIWLIDLARPIVEPFVPLGNQPIWSRDGRRIAFAASKPSRILDLYVAALDGNGRDELLLSTQQTKTASDWAPGDQMLLFRSIDPVTKSDLWALPMSGDRTPIIVLRTDADERDAQFSPDGQWMAYESDKTGRPEIYVQRFGSSGAAKQISTGGGTQVRWRSDGRELFYIREDAMLMAVTIERLTDDPIVRAPIPLFRAPVALGGPGLQQYTPSPNAEHFLVNVVRERPEPIDVVLHWKGLATTSPVGDIAK
jgi:dipeptidyl aminopeptidase/acylaminoacyl peptidase